MQNGIELARVPKVFVLDLFKMLAWAVRLQHLTLETYLFDLVLVRGLEDAVAGNVVALAADIFTDLAKEVAVRNADVRKERDEVVRRVSSVRAAVVETSRRQGFCEQLLTAEW